MEAKRKIAATAGLVAVYFVTGKLGLSVAYVHPSATGVWPPAGIALAALLLFGSELWPGVLLGAFLVNITTTGSPLVCLGIAAGNTLEAVAGAWLVRRFANGRDAFRRTPDVFRFALFAGLASTLLAATFGVTSLTLGGYAPWGGYRAIWTTWWLGDAAGNLLVAPLLLLWILPPRFRWRRAQLLERVVLYGCLIVTALIIFDGVLGITLRSEPLTYVAIPFVLWAAYRFGAREASLSTMVLAVPAIWGTIHGLGPFGGESHNESLLQLQVFLSVVSVTVLALATAFAERRSAEDHARALSFSDPLTGLGNYRKLIDSLEMEVRRSRRTGRPFAVLLMDLDNLKQINDTHGHLAGNRALCRVAEALCLYSRRMDIATRFGGDEFALVIPELWPELGAEFEGEVGGESGSVAVRRIAQRIAERVAADIESPAISVSIGAALFPEDGDTIEKLLNCADHALYGDKAGKSRGGSTPQRGQGPGTGTPSSSASGSAPSDPAPPTILAADGKH